MFILIILFLLLSFKFDSLGSFFAALGGAFSGTYISYFLRNIKEEINKKNHEIQQTHKLISNLNMLARAFYRRIDYLLRKGNNRELTYLDLPINLNHLIPNNTIDIESIIFVLEYGNHDDLFSELHDINEEIYLLNGLSKEYVDKRNFIRKELDTEQLDNIYSSNKQLNDYIENKEICNNYKELYELIIVEVVASYRLILQVREKLNYIMKEKYPEDYFILEIKSDFYDKDKFDLEYAYKLICKIKEKSNKELKKGLSNYN